MTISEHSLAATVRRLAARPQGVHCSDPALAGWSTDLYATTAYKLALRGEIHRAKISHRNVRYYTDKAEALRCEQRAASMRKTGFVSDRQTLDHRVRAWGDAKMVITDKTVFTQCPSYTPRFQAVELPGIAGGNQRGRVLREGL